jgi:uncharacterized protein (DUF924 family)
MTGWTDDILKFWFDDIGQDHWFGSDKDTDDQIRDRFAPLWEAMRSKKANEFAGSARQALAAVILFDQFPRNIFRNGAAAFATDPLAIEISKLAIAAGFDVQLDVQQQQFLYMPFMHSESIADQDLSIRLFAALGQAEPLQFAMKHRDVIKRFGRFPHRNQVLGRKTMPDEEAAVAEGENW